MPKVKLLKQVRVDLQQVNRGGIRQTDQLHEAEQHEQIVQFHELLAQPMLVACKGHSVEEIGNVLADFGPIHAVI